MKSTQGQPIIKVDVPQIFQLQYDEAGREAVKKVLTDYKDTKAALVTLDIKSQGPVRGSNIYFRNAVVNAYRQITGENVHPINARESEIALANDTLTDPTSTYEDLGLIVYPKEGVNPNLWENLREQVKSDFPNVKLSKPFVITGLMNVVKNSTYENGLGLNADELTEVYNVPILNRKTGKFDSSDKGLHKTGFPSKLGRGNRTLYVDNNNGVFGFYRYGNLSLNARGENLAGSNVNGRVNVVRNFSSGSLDERVAKLEQERLKKEKELQQQYELAVKQVRNIKLRRII